IEHVPVDAVSGPPAHAVRHLHARVSPGPGSGNISGRPEPGHGRDPRWRPRVQRRPRRSRGALALPPRLRLPEGASPSRLFVVVFRAFNDGVGFRYELPEQPGLGEFAVSDELTEFALADDARAWWIPSNRPRLDRSEMLFSSSPVSVLD